jgi:hypothetical protein
LDKNFGKTSREEFSVKYNLGTNPALPPGPKKITENLEHAGWSQELPDAYGLVDSSPAFEYARYGGSLYKYRQQSSHSV